VTTTTDGLPAAAEADEPTRPRGLSVQTLERMALAALLIGTAVMYLWNITVNGMANEFYAAAAQAGSKNWKALLFGSLDSQNFITVDKPPASQWVMALSGQIFGFSSASMLVPEALMAVAAVALMYGSVRRICGPPAGLLAGVALALMPVAALMFRFNNPDAVMVLLMMASAYCTVRALERPSAKWITIAGVALGFAFLAKTLEGVMVAPAIGLAYLIAAPRPFGKRVLDQSIAVVAFVVSSGWFVLLTVVWPASSRPYIAGSTDNSFMNLALGRNGFTRVLGHNHPAAGGPRQTAPGAPVTDQVGQAHRGGFPDVGSQAQGLTQLFSGEIGVEIGWLIPAALLAAVLVIVSRRRAPRTDLTRGSAILFGGWMLVDGLVVSYMPGNIHPYYCLSLSPAVAAMFVIGIHEMWRKRGSRYGRIGLAAMIFVTGAWSWWLLGRNGGWAPTLRWTILVTTVTAATGLLRSVTSPARQRFAVASLTVGLIGALAGSGAYALTTIGQPHSGGRPAVGPAATAQSGRADGGAFGLGVANPQLDGMLRGTHTIWSAAMVHSSGAATLELATNTAVMAIGGFSGIDPVPTLSQFQDFVANHRVTYYIVAGNAEDNGPGGGASGGHTDITNWVAANFTPIKVASDTVYNLTAPRAA
jgi:4-amino-4-deoxy-L-arabinose transferase-like glycosyltransferase